MDSFFRACFVAFLFFSHFSGSTHNSDQSREYDGIIAVVNDDIITYLDLEERVALFSIGEKVSDELRARVLPEVLKEMVQEKLKWQCAKKYAPKGGWATANEVKTAFSNIAKRNNLSYDSFCKLLESKNVSKNTLMRQIRINLSWISYINARFGKLVNVSETEVNQTIAQIKEKENTESYYVHRMFFPVSDNKNEGAVSSQVNNLKQMLLKGADFHNLARQFSQDPSANKGGEIGWIFHGQLSPEENRALGEMSMGEYRVVRNTRGYVILFLQDKKEAGLKSFTVLKFVQVIVPFRDANPPREEIESLMNYALDLKRNSHSCSEFIKRAKDSSFCGISDPVTITLEEMQPQFRSMIAPLQSGSIGNPLMTPNGIVTICMLDRKTQQIPEPTPNDIKMQKTNERLSVFADREIQDFRRKSEIKVSEKYGNIIK
ncbi:MAG: peptidylprolyl isomerase [Holosporaceae bacterium]|nr:peptidylprolyl isomerase [Holosporaceae bacterium]